MTDQELNIAVAKARGWHVAAYEIGQWTLHSPDGHKWSKFSSPEIAWSANCIPRPATDMGAAMELVNEMREAGSVTMRHYGNGWMFLLVAEEDDFEARDQSLPISICNAYLQWKGQGE